MVKMINKFASGLRGTINYSINTCLGTIALTSLSVMALVSGISLSGTLEAKSMELCKRYCLLRDMRFLKSV